MIDSIHGKESLNSDSQNISPISTTWTWSTSHIKSMTTKKKGTTYVVGNPCPEFGIHKMWRDWKLFLDFYGYFCGFFLSCRIFVFILSLVESMVIHGKLKENLLWVDSCLLNKPSKNCQLCQGGTSYLLPKLSTLLVITSLHRVDIRRCGPNAVL